MKKVKILCLCLWLPLIGFSQDTLSMKEVEGRRAIPMSETTEIRADGVYRYYAKGEDKPFTGILFARHANGTISSWQEYVNGIGHGKWINYYENGNYKEIGYYQQNLVAGPIQKFYPDGTLQAQGNYKDWRVKIGPWTYYAPDGSVAYTKDYGEKGSIEEVQAYYDRGDISRAWYRSILRKNGFVER